MNAASPTSSQRGTTQQRVGTPSLVLPAVVERELHVALHRRGARELRLKVARYGVIAVSLFMLFGTWIGSGSWGRTVQFFLFLAGVGLAVGPALQMSVGLFAEERRQQTLELLYLTGMGSVELFVGKLLAGALVSSNELLALAPLLAVPFLSGGVSFELFLQTLICLPTLFVLVLAIGALASALSKQEANALVITVVIAGVLCLVLPVPYNLGFWLTGQSPFDKAWLALSPVLGPWMVSRNSGGFRPVDFWRWAAAMWICASICLVLAAVVLKRNWRRDLERVEATAWEKRWKTILLGDMAWRVKLRHRVLALNPYQWLVQQDQRPVIQAWGFVAVICVLWLLGWCAWPRAWPSPLNFYTTALILLAGLDWSISLAASRRIAADRRDGSLELLLTTPLSPANILAGQQAAVAEQFRPVKLAVCGLFLAMLLGGFWARPWTWQGMVTYVALWSVFFFWCWRSTRRSVPQAMWVAANCGRALYTGFRQGGAWNRVWTFYWFWMVFRNFQSLGGLGRSFPSGSTLEMGITLSVLTWLLLMLYAVNKSHPSMADLLVSQLRSIAQEPLPERNDPRFKEWKDVRQRFPSAPGFETATRIEPDETKPIKAAGAWFWQPLGRMSGLALGKLQRAANNRLKTDV